MWLAPPRPVLEISETDSNYLQKLMNRERPRSTGRQTGDWQRSIGLQWSCAASFCLVHLLSLLLDATYSPSVNPVHRKYCQHSGGPHIEYLTVTVRYCRPQWSCAAALCLEHLLSLCCLSVGPLAPTEGGRDRGRGRAATATATCRGGRSR